MALWLSVHNCSYLLVYGSEVDVLSDAPVHTHLVKNCRVPHVILWFPSSRTEDTHMWRSLVNVTSSNESLTRD